VPALALWLAREFANLTEAAFRLNPIRRLGSTAFACAAFFLVITSDYGGRWTNNLTVNYLSPENPDVAGWLPDRGGVFYSDDMSLFYQTFFKNPHGDWRYMLGYEPTLMPEEDLQVYRMIQWNYRDAKAFEPWVVRMGPADRLVVRRARSGKPEIAALEWKYVATMIWSGRKPRAPESSPPSP
jgi:hypothetical protein